MYYTPYKKKKLNAIRRQKKLMPHNNALLVCKISHIQHYSNQILIAVRCKRNYLDRWLVQFKHVKNRFWNEENEQFNNHFFKIGQIFY